MTLFDNFFQISWIGRDIDAALEVLARDYGVTKVRRAELFDWLKQAHVWVGNVMLEIIVPEKGAFPFYDPYIPDDPSHLTIHHHGYWVHDQAQWDEVNRRVKDAGLDVPVSGTLRDGELNMIYVDTRAMTGLYSEYLYLTGAALTEHYGDVPRC